MDRDDALGQPLARQERPIAGGRSAKQQPPQRIPESHPPLLGDWFIYLSIVVLVCGVIAITALELASAQLASPFVRFPLLVGAALVALLAADATVRVWRSAWAWLPLDRGRGLFRFVWAGVLAVTLLAALLGIVFLITV